jgi:hypothetical protein
MVDQLRRELAVVEDRVSPVVDPDHLGKQFGAYAVRDALDRVDSEVHL